MKKLLVLAAAAPLALVAVAPASAETVVIKHRGASDFGHDHWRHGHAWDHRADVIRTGSVRRKVVIRHDGDMGEVHKKVIIHRED